MKKNVILITALASVATISFADNKTNTLVKKDTVSAKASNINAADVFSNKDIMLDAHVGFVDSFAIMGECKQGQKARATIESKRTTMSKDIQTEAQKIEKAKNEYVSKSSTMSDSAREKEEKKLMKMERDFKNLLQEDEEELKLDMQRETEKLAQEMDEGVVELAKQENLDVVFDKMTGRAIYVSEKFDFTDKAIKKVDQRYEIKLAQNKKGANSSVKVADNKNNATQSGKVGA